MHCPNCGYRLNAGERYCPLCGEDVNNRCWQCGKLLKSEEKYCSECGAKVIQFSTEENTVPPPFEERQEDQYTNSKSELHDIFLKYGCKIFEIYGPTDDEYRNRLVQKTVVCKSVNTLMEILNLLVFLRLLGEGNILAAIIVCCVIGSIFWLAKVFFQFSKYANDLKKYDQICTTAGRRTAIITIEANANNDRMGCLISCCILIAVLILMSLC